jgi:hypothetical protein
MLLAQFDDSFDQDLVAWFAPRAGVWSGTAAELLTALRIGLDVRKRSWPQSPRALYAHLESHRQILRSLGVDVRLHEGSPRMLSLRSCHAEEVVRNLPSAPPEINRPIDGLKIGVAGSGEVRRKADAIVSQDIPIARPDPAGRFVSGRYAEKDASSGRFFENTGEAVLAVAAMRDGIREQGLDLESAIDLVLSRTQGVTRCCGIAVGLLQEGTVSYPARAGIGTTMEGLDLRAKFFQSCIRTGGALQLRDAQKHPLFGATFRAEGVGSSIIVPIFHNRNVSAAMEFLFEEIRSFSTGCVMDLELIASVVSECSGCAAQIGLRRTQEWEIPTRAVETNEIQLGNALDKKAGPVDALPISWVDSNNAETPLKRAPAHGSTVLGLLLSRLVNAFCLLGIGSKRGWMQVLKQILPARYLTHFPEEKPTSINSPPLGTESDRFERIDKESSDKSSE